MLRGIKRKLQEGKERREEAHQEAERLRRLSEQRRLEEAREKIEIQNKVLAILRDGKVPDLHVNPNVPFKLQKNEKWILAVDNVELCRDARQTRDSGQVGRYERPGDEGRLSPHRRVKRNARRERCYDSQGQWTLCRIHQARVLQRRTLVPNPIEQDSLGTISAKRLGNRARQGQRTAGVFRHRRFRRQVHRRPHPPLTRRGFRARRA